MRVPATWSCSTTTRWCPPELVRTLVGTAAAHPSLGIVGPVISYMEEPDAVRTDGCRFNVSGTVGFFTRLEVPVSHTAGSACRSGGRHRERLLLDADG